MFFIIGFAVVSFVIGLYKMLDDWYDKRIWFTLLVANTAVAAVMALAGFGVSVANNAWVFHYERRMVYDGYYNLAALRDGGEHIQGTAFLFSTIIQSQPEYVYYIDYGNGRYQESYTPSTLVQVCEEDRKDAVLQVYHTEYATRWGRLFGDPKSQDWIGQFHVPTGTIRKGFSL